MIGSGTELQTNHGLVATQPHLLLNLLTKSCHRIVVGFHLSIPGQSHKGNRRDLHSVVELVEIAANDLVQWNQESMA